MKSVSQAPAILIVLLLVACAGPPPPPGNAPVLKRIEEKLIAAKTLRIAVSIEEIQRVPDKPELKRNAEVQIWVNGERMRVRMDEVHTQGKATVKGRRESISDRQNMKFLWLEFPDFEEERWHAQKTPPDWRVTVLRGLALFESEGGFAFIQPVGRQEKSVWTEHFPMPSEVGSALRITSGDAPEHRVMFSATERKGSGESVQYSGTVWIDTATFLPVKREKRYSWKQPPHGPRDFTVTEVFKILELDKPIDQSPFELPR